MTRLVELALERALREEGVQEVGQNRGQRIEEYLASVGLPPGAPYCAAFVFWCFDQAADELGIFNPLPVAGSVHKLWRKAPEILRSRKPAVGAIFCHDAGGGLGHTGLVVGVLGDEILTIEGNTNEAGEREGQGVHRKKRDVAYVNLGFIDYGRELPADAGLVV